MRDYTWISELAGECKEYSPSLGLFFAKAIAKVNIQPVPSHEMKRAWATLARDMVHFGFESENDLSFPPDMNMTMDALKSLGLDKLNQDMINEEKLAASLAKSFRNLFDSLAKYPEIFDMMDQADLLEDMLGTI